MPLDVLSFVDDARGEGLLVGLTLEDLFFDGTGRDEAVDEAVFFLAVAPDSRKGLLVSGRVPVYPAIGSQYLLGDMNNMENWGNTDLGQKELVYSHQ